MLSDLNDSFAIAEDFNLGAPTRIGESIGEYQLPACTIGFGIITPPGLDEQWLISLAHGQDEIDLLVEDFREFAKAIRA